MTDELDHSKTQDTTNTFCWLGTDIEPVKVKWIIKWVKLKKSKAQNEIWNYIKIIKNE